jgi:hypothetical protein
VKKTRLERMIAEVPTAGQKSGSASEFTRKSGSGRGWKVGAGVFRGSGLKPKVRVGVKLLLNIKLNLPPTKFNMCLLLLY